MDGDLDVDIGVTELNATGASLLGLLHEGPATGWDLLEQARRGLARFWNMTSSHVYRELKTLETRGLVRAARPVRATAVRSASPDPGGARSRTGSDRSRRTSRCASPCS